jgi:ABC-type multidrug transport system ATPase subunit
MVPAGAVADVQEEARALRGLIESHPERGSVALGALAERFAVDPKLRQTALVLRASLARAATPAHLSALTAEMLELVDAIVRDHETNADGEAARAQRAARERVAAELRSRPRPNEVVFEAKGLGKTYRTSGFNLHDVDLVLRRGEITAVVGENANGKTTLFRIVAGELRHDAGSISFPFLDPGLPSVVDWVTVKQQLAYVQQELPRWYGSLYDNLAYEAALRGIRGEENRRAVDFVVERLNLAEHLEKRWSQLSGGFKLRFALARALVWKPKLLLLDEPLANLDFKAQQVILRDLRDLAASYRHPMAVLISSQHLHEIEAVADSILFLRQGAVVYSGSIDQLGDARTYNTFELGAQLSEGALRERLAVIDGVRLSHTGVSWLVKTPLGTSGAELLEVLLRQGVEIDYFRDISRSVKQLFEQGG